MTQKISSAANPVVKRMRRLADRKYRRREGAFVVQGIQPVWQAVEAGAPIETLIVAPDLIRQPAALAMVAAAEAAGTPVARFDAMLFGRLADRELPGGLAAIVSLRPGLLADLPVSADSLYAVLHEAANPGNVGTIIRTASAVGAGGVVVIGPAADPYDPAAVKASMGALFSVPVAQLDSADEFLDWASVSGVRVVATSGRAAVSCWEAELPLPLAFLLGSEGNGLPDWLLGRAAAQVRIPMTGTAESLNLAVAAGILLYEARRRSPLALG
jgi:RNA methyltransferase, TrmH family